MSNLFLRDRRLLVLAILLITVAGLSSYAVLPRIEDPPVVTRNASITTQFPGANAERIEAFVTDPLEDELSEIKEIKEIRSVSQPGASLVLVELLDNVDDSEPVWSRIRDKIDDASLGMPEGVSDPNFKVEPSRAYALVVALRWEMESEGNYAILRRLADKLNDALKGVRGTEKVDTFGDPQEEFVVTVNAEELAARGLTPHEVAKQLSSSDAKAPAGLLRGDRADYLLEVDSELDSLARLDRTPIGYSRDGNFVRLGDIAHICKTITEPPLNLAIIDGRPAVALGVFVNPEVRLDHWSTYAKATLAEFAHTLPRGVGLDVVFEQDVYVEARLSGLRLNLLLGAVAVVVAVLFMMGWRNALVVGATLPLSTLMVIAGLRLLNVPIHQMSVTGLIIALGLLIDNAIVAVDEVTEKLRSGLTPAQAVSRTVQYLFVPLLGSTLTTTLAFAPIAIMPGPAGEFVGSIAVSVILAIASSLFLALTIVPALAALARYSKESVSAVSSWQHGLSHQGMARRYQLVLGGLFRRPSLGIVIGLALPLIGFVQSRHLPEQFFPPVDRNQFYIDLELPNQASLEATRRLVMQVREQLKHHPEVRRVDWFLGENAPKVYYNMFTRRKNASYYAQGLVTIDEAQKPVPLIHRIQEELDRCFPQARLLVRQLEQGPPFEAPVEVRLYGPDLDVINGLGNKLRLMAAGLPEVIHTRSGLGEVTPKLAVAVNEEAARLAGVDDATIANHLRVSLEGVIGGEVVEATERLPVRVRLPGNYRADLSRVASQQFLPRLASYSPNQSGPSASVPSFKPVSLAALSSIQFQPEASAIAHYNRRRTNEVHVFVRAGDLPSRVLASLQKGMEANGFSVPPGYSIEFGGEAAKRDDAVGDLMANVGILAVLMLATLVLSFRSFRMAGLILLVAVLSVGLGLGSLWLWGFPFGFMAIIGTMGLIGVAINDAIVVLASIRQDPSARLGDPDAVCQVVLRNTRHILATTLTTMAGFTPLLISGGEFWPPLAVTIAGGVSGATALALILVPAAYVLLMRPRATLI